jgi:hypothetical protein
MQLPFDTPFCPDTVAADHLSTLLVAGAQMPRDTADPLHLISEHVAASPALRDLVRESNQGNQIWFVADLDALDARLGDRDRPAAAAT